MQSPITGKEMKLHIYDSQLKVRKEAFDVKYHVYKCEDTGEEFETPALVEINLQQAMDQYRSKYNLPFPEEIRSIREQYGISAAKMSEVLRFGINQYKQYENGELPSESNASLIFLAAHPKSFSQLVELSSLSREEKDKLQKKIEALNEQNPNQQEHEWTTQLFMGSNRPDVERGFRRPSLLHFAAMISFFALHLSPFKTQMNKLLFYADFHHFRKHGRSISGAKYRAIEMGPVPNNFDAIFQFAENEHFVILDHHEFPNGAIGTKFFPNPAAKIEDYLTELELESLKEVLERFRSVKSQDIIQLSHEENAWVNNAGTRAIISYLDAYCLKAI